MKRLDGWAPPAAVWGPWVEFGALFGTRTYKVEFESISNAPSSFEAEVKYWSGAKEVSDIVIGPGSHTFTAGACVCVQRIRFRSHTLGQVIRVMVH